MRKTYRHGIRLLPYMNDFLFLAKTYEAALLLRHRVESMFTRLGLFRNPKKGIWTPIQIGDHLGLIVDVEWANSALHWTSYTP
jgi:hypothetical protein